MMCFGSFSLPQATMSFQVDYDACANLDHQGYDWSLKLYKLSSSPLAVDKKDFAPARQHASPMLLPELALGSLGSFFPPGRRGRGRGRGRAQRGRGGRGRGRAAALDGPPGHDNGQPPEGDDGADEPFERVDELDIDQGMLDDLADDAEHDAPLVPDSLQAPSSSCMRYGLASIGSAGGYGVVCMCECEGCVHIACAMCGS